MSQNGGKVVGAVGNPAGVGLLRALDFIEGLSNSDLMRLVRAYKLVERMLGDSSIGELFEGVMRHRDNPGEYLQGIAPSGTKERILKIGERVKGLKNETLGRD